MAKVLVGKIISTKMNKTVTVLVERKMRHPLYKKVITRHKKYKADNRELELNEGDWVEIKETRPISKDKHFKVIKKLN
jgi:small subunit ribosomal protein S17